MMFVDFELLELLLAAAELVGDDVDAEPPQLLGIADA